MTIDQLIEWAVAQYLATDRHKLRRNIEEWRRELTLPEAERPRIPGKEGRGPLVFPEGTTAVLAWLIKFRRYVRSAEAARFWLWMEGLPHVYLDAAVLQETVQQICSWYWAAMGQVLPLLAQRSEDETTRENLRDEIYRLLVEPKEAAGANVPELAARQFIYEAMLEVADPEDERDPVRSRGLAKMLREAGMSVDALPDDMRNALFERLRASVLQFPRSVELDWGTLQAHWRDFVRHAEELDHDPRTPEMGISFLTARKKVYRMPYRLALIHLAVQVRLGVRLEP